MIPGVARRDPRLQAVVVGRTALHYTQGADPRADRPAHVRAGSAIVALRGAIAVIQDDAGFVAWIRPDGAIEALPLPEGPDGRRQFDDVRGNKHHKLDLEAAFAVAFEGVEVIVAVGSGSSPARERLVVVPIDDVPRPPRVLDGNPLYEALRSSVTGELNIEGAFPCGEGLVRLLQRGNGVGATDATLDVALAWFEALLAGPTPAAPALRSRAWDLGSLDGARLTFTDGLAAPGGFWFLAAAEDSPDAVRDGPVTGSVVGRAAGDVGVWAPFTDPSGAPVVVKAEGLCPGERPGELFVVVDADDPERPAEILRVALEGPWDP